MKVGLLGLGEQMTDNILPTIIQLPNVEVSAICDIDKEKLSVYQRKFPQAVAFQDLDKLMMDDSCEVVVLSSDPKVHENGIKLAIQNKKHVFVEKPPVLSLEYLNNVISTLPESGIKTGVGFNFNYAEVVKKIDHCLNAGNFGEIISIRCNHYASKPRTYPFWDMESLYESFLLAQAIHPIGFILKYIESFNMDDITHRKVLNDENIQLEITISGKNNESPVLASIFTNNIAPFFDSQIEFITNKNYVIHINSLWNLSISTLGEDALLGKRTRYEWSPSPVGNGLVRAGYYLELEEFFRSIEQDVDFDGDLYFAQKVYAVLDKLTARE